MKKISSALVALLCILALAGCKNMGTHEHPSSEHPSAEGTPSEHPQSEHPK
jgi:predicted small lipoprotein YifL